MLLMIILIVIRIERPERALERGKCRVTFEAPLEPFIY